MRRQVFSLLVDNNPGVLSRIAGQYRQYHGGNDRRSEVYKDHGRSFGG